jgi:predicted nucleic acid-binding Zn ribbon protein
MEGTFMLSNDDSGPKKLRDILDPFARRVGMDAGAATGRVWSEWESIVGADIADHAEPTSLRRGVLRIRTDSPVWATELTYLSEEIRNRVNERLGRDEVTGVKIWTAPGKLQRAAPAAPSRPPPERRIEAAATDPTTALRRARAAWDRARRGTR